MFPQAEGILNYIFAIGLFLVFMSILVLYLTNKNQGFLANTLPPKWRLFAFILLLIASILVSKAISVSATALIIFMVVMLAAAIFPVLAFFIGKYSK